MGVSAKVVLKIEVDVILDITEIRLLTADEYKNYKEYIKNLGHWWWLQSPGSAKNRVLSVCGGGGLLYEYGSYVDRESGWVRPVLRISNLTHFIRGDNLVIANRDWTVISRDLVLSDEPIGEYAFREDWKAEDANDYNASDVKKYLENWANENGIVI